MVGSRVVAEVTRPEDQNLPFVICGLHNEIKPIGHLVGKVLLLATSDRFPKVFTITDSIYDAEGIHATLYSKMVVNDINVHGDLIDEAYGKSKTTLQGELPCISWFTSVGKNDLTNRSFVAYLTHVDHADSDSTFTWLVIAT